MLFLEDILKIPSAETVNVEQYAHERFPGVSTDSRTINEGQIFVAVRGEKFDGHNFVEQVFANGIRLTIVEKKWYEDVGRQKSVVSGSGLIVVDDTIKAYGILANIWRKKFDIPVIAISGSNGKTTTKEMLTKVLETQYNIHSTQANNNNHIGVPQTLFGIHKETEIAVLELGSNHLGEIEYLSHIVSPTHSLVTNIGKEHLEFFGSLENIGKEETTTFSHSLFGFVNEDDAEIQKWSSVLKKKTTYAFNENADVKGNVKTIDENGCATIAVRNSYFAIHNLKLQIAGIHNATNALASATVGNYFGISTANIATSLENVRAYNMRMEILKANSITIINDTYNSNTDSVIAALQTLQQMKTRGKKIIVLGDMLELGKESEIEHKRIGKIISEMDFTYLLAYGNFSKLTSENARIQYSGHYSNKQKLIVDLQNIISENDIVLVKGSRGMKMEEVVNSLLMNS